jgi:glycosyltransferase involved in cell wall biosynthesis
MGDDFPLFLLPYAVDNAWFQERCRQAAATRGELLAELGMLPGRAVILFASKLQTRKLCSDLVSAYAAYVDGLSEPPYLLIVGDGEERAALEQQVADLGLDSARFCGFRNQTEMPRFLELAAVFVLPARHEPWGLIVNEAMNAGCAVIVSDDVGCHPDLVTDGIEGRVYPVGDVQALTASLGDALDHAGTMGAAALARIGAWSFEQDVAGLKQALAHVTRKLPEARA